MTCITHRVLLVLAMLGIPLLARANPQLHGDARGGAAIDAPWARASIDESVLELASHAVRVEGHVLLPDGAPAAGAVVISGAGGLTEVAADGSFVLEVLVDRGASSLRISAFASGLQGSSAAHRFVTGITSQATLTCEPLLLAAGSGCAAAWLPTFGGVSLNNPAQASAVFDDGTGPALYVAGSFTYAGGQPASRIAKWDGSAWSPLGSGLGGGGSVGSAWALAVLDDGAGAALYVGGDFTSAGGQAANRIAKWDGATWSPLGSGMDARVSALATFDDGSGPALYAGGSFLTAGGQSAERIARWDGSSWSGVGSGMNERVLVLGVHDYGSGAALYAGGWFTIAGNAAADRIACWDGGAWTGLAAGTNNLVYSLASFDDGTGPALYVGGEFTSAGGVPANRVARWDGTTWSALGTGMDNRVYSLTVFDDGAGPAL